MLLVFVSGTTLFLVLQLVAAQMQIFWLIHLAFRHFIDNKIHSGGRRQPRSISPQVDLEVRRLEANLKHNLYSTQQIHLLHLLLLHFQHYVKEVGVLESGPQFLLKT